MADRRQHEYTPTPTMLKFHQSKAYVRCVAGPVGTGKTSGCSNDAMMNFIITQPPGADGVRRSRGAFVRNTLNELKNTTVKSWLQWFGFMTVVKWSPPIELRVTGPLEDGTSIDCLIHCIYQDKPGDEDCFRGLELTWIWFNEGCLLPWVSIVKGMERVGRYPAKEDGGDKARFGIICDTNMPDDLNWYYLMKEVKKPSNWEFFQQPPAMFPVDLGNGRVGYTPNVGQRLNQGILPAENVQNQPKGWKYYLDQIPGHPHDWILVFICGHYGTVSTGKGVYQEYSDLVHYRDQDFDFDPLLTLFLGFDFGLTPAVVFGQVNLLGQLKILEESCGTDIGIESFMSNVVMPKLVNKYHWGHGSRLFVTCDPAGVARKDTNENTCINILKNFLGPDCPVIPCPTNDLIPRLEAVRYFLSRTASKGEPGFLLSRNTAMLRKGFQGWYFYKRLKIHRDEVYEGEPMKNSFSHPHDALQYLCYAARHTEMFNISFSVRAVDDYGRPILQQEQKTGLDMDGFV